LVLVSTRAWLCIVDTDMGQAAVLNLHQQCSFFSYSLYFCSLLKEGARRGVVGWGTMLQAGRSRVRFPMKSLDFLIHLILPAAL
jgi:hypothetical protein